MPPAGSTLGIFDPRTPSLSHCVSHASLSCATTFASFRVKLDCFVFWTIPFSVSTEQEGMNKTTTTTTAQGGSAAMDVDGGGGGEAGGAGGRAKAKNNEGGGRGESGRWLVGDLAVSRRRDGMEMRSPLVDGLLSDWDQVRFQGIWGVEE